MNSLGPRARASCGNLMDHFTYQRRADGAELCAEGVTASDIAHRVGTPTYVYSSATLTRHTKLLQEAFAPVNPLICFAVKSCPNVHVLRLLSDLGLGMDVVSGGELARARAAGTHASKIVFAGVGKTEAEIDQALGNDDGPPVDQFNVESEQELDAIARVASRRGVVARVALRVNPMVTAGGHAHIQTATPASKFGVSIDQALTIARGLATTHGRGPVALRGLHMHLGSSIVTPEPYARAIPKMLALADEIAALGHTIDTLDIGGGFGADYRTGDAPSPEAFAQVIVPLLIDRARAGLRVVIEPGRFIAANAGVLLTRVLYVKPASHGDRRFVVVDAGMNTLMRPALYSAFHFLWPTRVSTPHTPLTRGTTPELAEGGAASLEVVDVVGPVCESTDVLGAARALPPMRAGDLVAVFAAGAYGMSMASRYNSHPLPAEVLVDGDSFTTIRRRETTADLLAHELAEPGSSPI